MRKTIRSITVLVTLLLIAIPAHADVVWPALFLISRMLTWWSVALGLIVEYFFVRQLTGFDIKTSIKADLVMNGASTLLGAVLIPIAGIGWEFFPGLLLYKIFNIGTFNPGTWTATFIMSVLINAWLENYVIKRFFKKDLGWRGFRWLCLANAASVGIAFISLWLFPVEM